MTEQQNALAAEILETSAAGFAAAANAILGERLDGQDHASAWKPYFTQRIAELAAALRVDDASVFVRRVEWLRRAYQARGADETELAASLECLRDALEHELPATLRPAVEEPLAAAIEALGRELEPSPEAIDATTALGRLALEYLKACLEGHTDEAMDLVLGRIGSEVTPETAFVEVLMPAQRETGQLWHGGDISVAEEHLVSDTTRRLIDVITHTYAPPPGERSMLAASVAGNAHDLGLRIVNDLFRLAGWRTLFLGSDVPAHAIAQAAGDFDIDLVLLNATLATQLKQLGETIEAIKAVRPGARVLAGGLAFEELPDLWRRLGADGYAADARGALETAARLFASR